MSAAPTVSAAREPPGPEMLPYPGPATPSFPAGVTTRVSSRRAPATARAEGLSSNAAKGSATPTSATLAASSATPSAFGSTARSSPATSWSVRPKSAHRPTRFPLPARDPDRKDRRAAGDPVQAGGPFRPDHQPRHLRSVPLEIGSDPRGSRSRRHRDRSRRRRTPRQPGRADTDASPRLPCRGVRSSRRFRRSPGERRSVATPSPRRASLSRSGSTKRRPGRRCGRDRRRRPPAHARAARPRWD